MKFNGIGKSGIIFSLILLLFAPKTHGQSENELINNYLKGEQLKNDWLSSDISDWVITDQYTDKSTNLTYTYIQQRHNHIVVFNAISNFLIKENKIIHFTPGIVGHLKSKIKKSNPAINAKEAIGYALKYLGKEDKVDAALKSQDDQLNKFVFESSTLSSSPIKVQLVYRQMEESIFLAWDVSIEMKDEPHWWNIRINALTGDYIDKNDFVVSCDFDNPGFSDSNDEDFLASPSTLGAIPDYNIFPFPLEAPNFGSRALLTDPSNSLASPYGWHDYDGIIGEEYTITRGNNVYSYEDANNDNLPGYSPDGGVNLHFDFPFLPNPAPIANQDACLTNLFYANNAIHDYLYQQGFTEAAGNFQKNNYGRGGAGNDYVRAEGLDGAGTNNANFGTPNDGFLPRMQMYLWSGNVSACTNLNIASANFTGPMTVGSAAFSPAASVAADLILVNDGVGTVTDACTPIVNNIAGKVALIDRSSTSCSYVSKAQAAQNAGAVGVIIANNTGTSQLLMAGSPMLSIPCISVSLPDGNILKNALLAGNVTVTINTCVVNQIDGSFDNGIIAHEYGHGVSNRLTGGPAQSSCLSNGEQGGEGWSDWLALMMTIEPGDQGSDARGIGTYVIGNPSNGTGIRTYPYSTNMVINPHTYADVASNPEVHGIGEVWCSAIWDMSWFLIDQFGFSSNPLNASTGNNIAMRLVLEGMKLQPCNPGFLDSRDAILTADAILYNNVHRCLIWQAFARRGMGYNALQGSANVKGDETAGFQMPPYCSPPVSIPDAAFISDLSSVSCGGTVKFTDQSVQAFEWHWDFGDQTTSAFQNPVHTFTSPGSYFVKLVVSNPLGSDSITSNIIVTPAFSVNVSATPNSICNGDQVNLSAAASGSTNRAYIVTNIPFAPVTGTATTVTLADDQMSSAKPIGFTFNFYGQNYTSFYICSNGFITFSSGMPANVVYGVPVPSSSTPNNLIALAWNDLYPPQAGSSIGYFTTGSSPNRKLVVKYKTVHYGTSQSPFTQYPFEVQAVLYEGTNDIEIHTTAISDASVFDEGATTTQGVENASGTNGTAVPGRNGTIFSASNDAYRFTQVVPYSYSWNPGNLNGPLQTVTPASTGAYTVTVSDGTACAAAFSTSVITVNNCVELNTRNFLEGFYIGNSNMAADLYNTGLSGDSTACDSIIIELHDPVQTNTIAASQKVLLYSDGHAAAMFSNSVLNQSYYVVIRQRNSIETWSANPVLMSSITNYDFTTASSMAYGNNMVDVGTPNSETPKWAFYSGDISDASLGVGFQDGVVESQDYSDMENAISITLVGYVPADISGDGVVESFDYSVMENNVYYVVSVMRP